MPDTVYARAHHVCRHSAAWCFDAWLDPDKVRTWLAAALREGGLPGDMRAVVIDARTGGSFLFSDQRDGGEAKHWGRYELVDRPHRLVFTWITNPDQEADPSRVDLQIQSHDDGSEGCTMALTHAMDAAWADWVPKVELGWSRMLSAIDRLD